MAGRGNQGNKRAWFFTIIILAVLVLTGLFVLYKYIQNNNKNSNNFKESKVESSALPFSNPALELSLIHI